MEAAEKKFDFRKIEEEKENEVIAFLVQQINKLEPEQWLPFVDLLRTTLLQRAHMKSFVKEAAFLEKMAKSLTTEEIYSKMPRATKIVVLRLLVNTFKDEAGLDFFKKKLSEFVAFIKKVIEKEHEDRSLFDAALMLWYNLLIHKKTLELAVSDQVLLCGLILPIAKSEETPQILLDMLLCLTPAAFETKEVIAALKEKKVLTHFEKSKIANEEKAILAYRDLETALNSIKI